MKATIIGTVMALMAATPLASDGQQCITRDNFASRLTKLGEHQVLIATSRYGLTVEMFVNRQTGTYTIFGVSWLGECVEILDIGDDLNLFPHEVPA